MRPQPPTRRTSTGSASLPKAAGPDPAALTAPTTSRSSNDSTDSRKGNHSSDSTAVGRLSIRMDADMLGRARSAWRAETAAAIGRPYQPFGQWVAALIAQATTDTEKRLNNGRPFQPTPPGHIPYGNPPATQPGDL